MALKTISEHFAKQKARKSRRSEKRIENKAQSIQASKVQGRPVSANGKPILKTLPSWRSLRDALDAVFSLFIRLRDKKVNRGLCLVCGKRPITLTYHIISRSAFGTRWDPENCVGACSGCNYSELMNRRKKNDHYAMWLERLGAKKMEELCERSISKTKYSRDELSNMIKEYREKLSK